MYNITNNLFYCNANCTSGYYILDSNKYRQCTPQCDPSNVYAVDSRYVSSETRCTAKCSDFVNLPIINITNQCVNTCMPLRLNVSNSSCSTSCLYYNNSTANICAAACTTPNIYQNSDKCIPSCHALNLVVESEENYNCTQACNSK